MIIFKKKEEYNMIFRESKIIVAQAESEIQINICVIAK